MSNPRGVRGLAFCLIFSPAAAVAESSPMQAAAGVARAVRPGCAKLVCQRRALSADRGVNAEQPATEANPSGVSVLVGLGAGSFRGPKPELGYTDLEIVQESYPEDATAPPGSAPIDSEGPTNYERGGSRRTKLEGPAVSLGVSLTQPLLGAAALRLGLEERFILAAVLPLSSGSCFAGFGDILLTARQVSWPVQVAAGPSLAVAQLNVRDDELGLFEEAGVIVGGAALLRLGLASIPGTLDLVGHYGKPLNYEDGSSYRDLQLAFALRL
ncbi:MAG: hypothetical protein ABI895_19380 [Deltaproteobacteria bacterium]